MAQSLRVRLQSIDARKGIRPEELLVVLVGAFVKGFFDDLGCDFKDFAEISINEVVDQGFSLGVSSELGQKGLVFLRNLFQFKIYLCSKTILAQFCLFVS